MINTLDQSIRSRGRRKSALDKAGLIILTSMVQLTAEDSEKMFYKNENIIIVNQTHVQNNILLGSLKE